MHTQVSYINSQVVNYINRGVIVLDTETTGFSRENDRIIEFAASKVENGVVVDKLELLINPCKSIHPSATAVNGITNEMVENQPTEEKYLEKIALFLSGPYYIVAHNAKFDLGFLDAMFKRNNMQFKCTYLDTLQLSRKYYPQLGSHKLSYLAEYLGLEVEGYHRAGYDVDITIQLLREIVKEALRH